MFGLVAPAPSGHGVAGGTRANYGAAHRPLGRLAATMGKLDEATDHLERALAAHISLRARPFVARSRLELARVIVDRDAARARELLTEARADADALGMAGLVGECDAFSAQLSSRR